MNVEVSRTIWISTPAGTSFCRAATVARTLSTTSTVFAFVCFVMSMATAGLPLISASVRCSSTVSSTVATSPSRMGWPARRPITICRYSAASRGLPLMRSGISSDPRVRRPSGVFTFSLASPATTSSTPMPSAASRAGSRLTAISRLDAPTSFAFDTPGTLSRRRLIFRSASSVRSRGDIAGDCTASEITGIALKSNFWMTGSFIPSGSSRRTPLIFARASCDTSLTFTSRLNSTMTDDSPSRETETTCLTPAIGFTASSIFRLTSRSTVSGDAPGYSVMIDSTGISTSGIMSIGSCRMEKTPSVTRVSIITVATTGRLMDRFERNMATPLRPWSRPPGLRPSARNHPG